MRHFFKDVLEPFSYLIYTFAFLLTFYRDKSNKRKVLFTYYLIATALLLVACYTKEDIINNCLYNVFFLITICVFSYYFKSIIPSKTKGVLIYFLSGINAFLFVKSDIVFHRLFQYNSDVYAITFLSIVVFALFYFDEVIRNVNELNLLHQFDFWLVSGYLLYFLSSFFIIVFYHEVEITQRAELWSLQNIILFLSSALTLTGRLWIYYQNKFY